MNNSIGQGLRGQARKRLMQIHKLSEFGIVFDRYLNGQCGPDLVKKRAKKMLQAGLPPGLPHLK